MNEYADTTIDAINPKPEVVARCASPSAIVSRVVGKFFRILKGGMGIVYIVYDHEHRLAYAAKTFRDDKHTDNSETAAETSFP